MSSLNRELLEEIVALSAESLLVIDSTKPEIPIVHANPAYAAESGYPADELAGSSWLAQIALEDDAPELTGLRQRMAAEDALDVSLPFLRKDGEIRLGRLRLQALRSATPERGLWLVQHESLEVTAGDGALLLRRVLSRAKHKLANLDRLDAVTGLLSRSELDRKLRSELALVRREGGSISLLLFAVPELDIYRQTFGDNAADSCLRMIGAQLSGTFRRASDLCARFDRALFAAVIRGQEEAQAAQLVEIVETKARRLGLHNPRGRIGRTIFVSGAAVQADPAGEDFDALIARAEAALAALAASPSSAGELPAATGAS